MTYRLNGKNTLMKITKHIQNAEVVEEILYTLSQGKDGTSQEDTYKEYVYFVIGDILMGKKLKDIVDGLRRDAKIGWNHPIFDDISFRIREQDDFIVNPFEVEEGVIECRCGSKRVLSHSKQSRSADEPMSTYAQCMACKACWVYSG